MRNPFSWGKDTYFTAHGEETSGAEDEAEG